MAVAMMTPLLGTELGAVAGSWETPYGKGQVGIHIAIRTVIWKSVENVESLAVQVHDGVEHRWFMAGDGVTSWDGTRLRIKGPHPLPSIDLRFHSDELAWTGVFAGLSRGENREQYLKRLFHTERSRELARELTEYLCDQDSKQV